MGDPKASGLVSGSASGFVSIVGAGPWDPGLLTLAGLRRLQRADVVIADYLVNPNLLLHAPAGAELIQREAGPRGGAKLLQPQLNALMIDRARAGAFVVRLKGGDPCMFGRGAEEAQALRAAGIEYELVPGVSSPIAAPEAAGIPVTHRDHTPAVTFVSGFEAYDKAGLSVAWEHLAKSAGTIVLMMSIRNARHNAERLVAAGRDPSTPAAVVRWGTRGIQRTVVGRLDTIADRIEAEGIRAPAVLVLGDVVNLREHIGWLESRPLFGRRVVVTRPWDQAQPLVIALEDLGADVVAVPTLAIRPPDDVAALDAAVASVADGHGVIVSSTPGVTALFDALARVGLDARALAGKTVVAVGKSTARACTQRGVIPDIIPEAARSEGIVEALRGNGSLGKNWLHVRARTGRPEVGRAITAAGGRYELAVGYQTIAPAISPTVVRSLRAPAEGGEGFDAVLLASGKTAEGFARLLAEALGSQDAARALKRALVVCIGPVTADAVRALGIAVDATAVQPDDAGMIAALRSALAPRPTG